MSTFIEREFHSKSTMMKFDQKRRRPPQKGWASCYGKPSAKAPVNDPGDEAPFLVWGRERARAIASKFKSVGLRLYQVDPNASNVDALCKPTGKIDAIALTYAKLLST